MDKRQILVIDAAWAAQVLDNPKLERKAWFPLGGDAGWLRPNADLLIRYRSGEGELSLDSSARLVETKGVHYLESRPLFHSMPSNLGDCDSIFLVVEGAETGARVTVHLDREAVLNIIAAEEPDLRLHVHDLPPIDVTTVTNPDVARTIHKTLCSADPELHSRRAEKFVHSPHILFALLSHVMELKSKEQIAFVSYLRCISDQFRELVQDRIIRLERSHRETWSEWYGRRISFSDGGMANISGLPGSDPLAVRVGTYTVIPGETNVEQREEWHMDSYVAGDIINEPVDPEADQVPIPDRKRLQEAARYIHEALSVVKHLESAKAPEVLFLHGPLVNAFEMYDEGEPNYLPAVDRDFLARYGIAGDDVMHAIDNIPSVRGRPMWNQCMAIYGYLLNRIFELQVPVVGVVERTGSTRFARELLYHLVREGRLTRSLAAKLRKLLDRYRITDSLLFGCVLDAGEYLRPILLEKNLVRRARDRWQPVVQQYPQPLTTYLKTSAGSFPYRVEFNATDEPAYMQSTMNLLYHTSRLLPEYAFPVGLDIADKYAKVPDWLSRGISAGIAAQAMAKAVATGRPRVVRQVRRLLAQSPRDFYFRPNA